MNVQNPKGLKPGEARCDAPSVQDFLDKDTRDVPEVLRRESYDYMGSEPIDPARYTTAEFAALEMEKVWKHVWQLACHEDEIAEVGDHIIYEIGDLSFIIARTGADEIKAYHNVCLHRANLLVHTDGNAEHFRCSYHGFTWNLDGTLKEVPCRWDFPHVDDEDYALPQAQTGAWGGFVFINPDLDAEPLVDFIAGLPEEFTRWDYDKKYKAVHVRKRVAMNWKVGVEAFIESFHVITTHPQLMRTLADANTQYDVDPSQNWNRMITSIGETSPHIGALSEQEIVDSMTGRISNMLKDDRPEDDPLLVPEGMTARQFMAEMARTQLAADTGRSFDHATDSEILDAIQYWVFPNMFPWGGPGQNIVYRFRPDGVNPDSAIMEVILMRPYDTSKPKPEPCDVFELGDDEDWDAASEILGGLAPIFAQDMANMPQVQRGLHAAARRGGKVTLGNYQESRIRHLHLKLDEFIAKY